MTNTLVEQLAGLITNALLATLLHAPSQFASALPSTFFPRSSSSQQRRRVRSTRSGAPHQSVGPVGTSAIARIRIFRYCSLIQRAGQLVVWELKLKVKAE